MQKLKDFFTLTIPHAFQKIGEFFKEQYKKNKWKLLSIIAGIVLIILALAIAFAIHFSNSVEEKNINEFSQEPGLIQIIDINEREALPHGLYRR